MYFYFWCICYVRNSVITYKLCIINLYILLENVESGISCAKRIKGIIYLHFLYYGCCLFYCTRVYTYLLLLQTIFCNMQHDKISILFLLALRDQVCTIKKTQKSHKYEEYMSIPNTALEGETWHVLAVLSAAVLSSGGTSIESKCLLFHKVHVKIDVRCDCGTHKHLQYLDYCYKLRVCRGPVPQRCERVKEVHEGVDCQIHAGIHKAIQTKCCPTMQQKSITVMSVRYQCSVISLRFLSTIKSVSTSSGILDKMKTHVHHPAGP